MRDSEAKVAKPNEWILSSPLVDFKFGDEKVSFMKGRKEFTAKARSCQPAHTLTEIGGQESPPTRSQTPLFLSNLDINQERKRGKMLYES